MNKKTTKKQKEEVISHINTLLEKINTSSLLTNDQNESDNVSVTRDGNTVNVNMKYRKCMPLEPENPLEIEVVGTNEGREIFINKVKIDIKEEDIDRFLKNWLDELQKNHHFNNL